MSQQDIRKQEYSALCTDVSEPSPVAGKIPHFENKIYAPSGKISDWFDLVGGPDEEPRLPGNERYWRYYPSGRKQAEDAAAHAFSKLPPERQSELLGHTTPQQMKRMARARRRMSKITSI
jgi:hypothetical protein